MAQRPATNKVFDVAIVGYGPTGATLANLLAKDGLNILVLEREAELYPLPRAVHFDDEVMRVFDHAGIAAELSTKIRVNPGMRFVDKNGTLLMDWPRPQDIGKHGWHASYRFHQPDLENLLRKAAAKYKNVTVHRRSEVTLLEDLGSQVNISYKNGSTRSSKLAQARFVVGCDGARSFVRSHIGSDMEDLGFDERWLVIDALLKRPMPELGDHSIQHCDPVRPITYCRSPKNRRRWEIKMTAQEDPDEMVREKTVWCILEPWIKQADADLERIAIYQFKSAIARAWRSDRLLLAGDAAHLTPPFMGQGMCAGIRDASNLAWKLTACITGVAQETILDSYQTERSPHVREYITTAIRLGGLINTLDQKKCEGFDSAKRRFPDENEFDFAKSGRWSKSWKQCASRHNVAQYLH